MPEFFPCPHFADTVECTDERYAHILEGHSDLVLRYWERVSETLAYPNRVFRSDQDPNGTVFIRWYDDLEKNILAVVISDANGRHWLITAYMTRKMPKGEVLWVRS